MNNDKVVRNDENIQTQGEVGDSSKELLSSEEKVGKVRGGIR